MTSLVLEQRDALVGDGSGITRIVFFDMDGTLVASERNSNHVHQDAFEHGINVVFDGQVSAKIEEVVHQGKTDCWILQELLALKGISEAEIDEKMPALCDAMVEYCREHRSDIGTGLRVVEGIPVLLRSLAGRTDTILGLVTGNLMRIAFMKVVAAGLDGHFTCGGFGSDYTDRAELIRIGVNRAVKRYPGIDLSKVTVYHVGDTPYDLDAALRATTLSPPVKPLVASAHKDGLHPPVLTELGLVKPVRGVGVATGIYTLDQLRAVPGDHYAVVQSFVDEAEAARVFEL